MLLIKKGSGIFIVVAGRKYKVKIGNNVSLISNRTRCTASSLYSPIKFIGAGSVVVKDIPPNCLATGSPAKVIKYYSNNDK